VVSRSIHAPRTSLLSILAALFLLAGPRASPARADLVLNEVLYDPSGADEGNEFVELWNPDRIPRALAGIAIEAADGAKPDVWSVIFRGTDGDSVAPGSAFLVPASALSGPIQNGPDALRLTRAGVVLDRLGYGDLTAASLYEGAPAPDVASGHSLARLTDGLDSDRNADDWGDEPKPTPGRANHPDQRLELSPDGVRIDPAVPWPGETAVARAWVRNRGRLALLASAWEIAAERSSPAAPATHGAPLPVAIRQGVSLAAGESTLVELPFTAGEAGAFSLLVRVGPASQADVGDDAPELRDSVWVAARVLASPCVIDEIAFRDAGVGEWVELWMREPVADAGEILLADASSTPRVVERGPDPRPLQAGAFLVLAQNPAAVRARFGLDSTLVLGLAGGWPILNDTDNDGVADVVRVLTMDGAPSDVVPYSSRASSRGGTLERLSPDLPGHLAGTWGESVDPAQATPGRPNSLRAPDRPLGRDPERGALLLASARVLRRGEGSPLLLRTTPDARGRELVIEVFDLLGRSVRTLVDGQRFQSEAAFAWDGRDSNGNWVSPGLYVVAARATAEDGRGPRDSAIPVAVSAAGARP
jgi:hypothetical protein